MSDSSNTVLAANTFAMERCFRSCLPGDSPLCIVIDDLARRGHVLSNTELKELTILNKDRIIDAIKKGETEKAIRLVIEDSVAHAAMHDIFVGMIDKLLATLGQELGDDAIHEHWISCYKGGGAFVPDRRTEETPWPIADESTFKLPVEDLVRFRAKQFRQGHDWKFRIEEDDEKFTFILECTSGGLVANRPPDRPLFGAPLGDKDKTRKAYPWTLGIEKLSYYCAHCPMLWEKGSMERAGYPRIIFEPPQKLGDRCIQYLYKDPRKIPEKYYKRMGVKRKV